MLKPFTAEAQFDHASFVYVVSIATRMLDNVLAATHWPLERQYREAQNKRRVGLGFTGLGNTLAMLGYQTRWKPARWPARFPKACVTPLI